MKAEAPNSKVEYIKKFDSSKCHACLGTGFAVGPGVHRSEALKKLCTVCDGTGRWIEDNYHLIATQPDGQIIGFQVDGFK